ncbi:hypothetical protein PMI05_05087 [Brevibacillus sp. BC25]|nr:hypothetical protein PMI05_05087 [Brevibacillus sp. BC25]
MLEVLAKEDYIEGQRSEPDTMAVLEAWERKEPGRWQTSPLSMRFVLPEQRELYLQMKEDEKLISVPDIEQDELESFHYIIRDSAREDYAITVTGWGL